MKLVKHAAESVKTSVLPLIPDSKLQTINYKPHYSKEDRKLIEDLEGEENEHGWAQTPDSRTITPFTHSKGDRMQFMYHSKTSYKTVPNLSKKQSKDRKQGAIGNYWKGQLSRTAVANRYF